MKFDMSQAWRDATAMLSGNREVLLVVAGLFFLLPGIALALALGDVQQAILADPKNAEAMMLAVAQGVLTEVSDIATELRRLGIVT